MEQKIDRLRRQQQRLWRKAAVSLLSLHQNITILIAFLMITVLGILWVMLEHKLDHQMSKNARNYGYGISRYAAADLKDLILSKDEKNQNLYLARLTNDPLIVEAILYDALGVVLAKQSQGSVNAETSINTKTQILLEDINVDGQRIGIVQLKIDQALQQEPINNLMRRISFTTVAMMIIMTFVAWLLAKRLTRSLRKLIRLPLNSPQEKSITNIDISGELRLMLESTTSSSDSPAPVSRAEESGIHQLLAADSVTEMGNLIVMKLCLPDLSSWLKPETGTPNVHLLRQLDRLLIVTIHSQQGHLLNFDGITAQACFGLDGDMKTATFRAVSCCLLLNILLEEISLSPKVCLREEERLLIRHMKRTPVAIPIHSADDENERIALSDKNWLLLNKNIIQDERLLEQMELVEVSENWSSIKETHKNAQSMIERQLAWIRFLLENTEKTT